MQDKGGTSSFPLPQALLAGAREPERGRGLSKSALFFCATPQRYLAFCVLVGASFTHSSVRWQLRLGAVHHGPSAKPDASHVPASHCLFRTSHLNTTAGPGSIIHSCNSYSVLEPWKKTLNLPANLFPSSTTWTSTWSSRCCRTLHSASLVIPP